MGNTKFCPQCGTEVPEDVAFCPACGHQFKTQQAASDAEPTVTTDESRTQQPVQPPKSHHRSWVAIVIGVLAVIAIVIVTSNVISQNRERAHQQALQSSESRVASSKKASESRLESREQDIASTAKGVVNDIIQNDDNLDAECTDITIESYDGNNQYSGYASVKDDYDDSTTIDITVTDVKYDNSISVHIAADQDEELNDTFYSNDD